MIFTDKGMDNYLYEEECKLLIGACYEVHNALGHGFLESVYHEALELEFMISGISFESEKRLDVWYKSYKLDHFFIADFICFNKIIIEMKACDGLCTEHTAQLLNYLKATKFKLGLLINFGTPRVQIKRVIL